MSDDEDHVAAEWTRPTPGDDPGSGSGSDSDPGPGPGHDEAASPGVIDADAPVEPDAESIPEAVARRVQARFGLSDEQWFVVESLLLFLPYPLFALVYFSFPVPEVPFLAVTVVYSVFAVWFGFRGATPRRS
jgi:hypothetical protein